MKTTKLLSLGLAALISAQSIAGAQSRVEGIGEAQILAAQEEMNSIKLSLLDLDRVLADTEKAIKKREKGGRKSNAVAIASAGLGLALGVWTATLVMAKKNRTGAIMNLQIAVPFAGLATLISATTGTGSSFFKPGVKTDEVKKGLEQTQEALLAEINQTEDGKRKEILTGMSNSLNSALTSLESFKAKQDEVSRNTTIAHVTQFMSGFLLIASMAGSDAGFILAGTGILAGNVGRIVLGLSSSQSEEVLAEITKTRAQLHLVFEQL